MQEIADIKGKISILNIDYIFLIIIIIFFILFYILLNKYQSTFIYKNKRYQKLKNKKTINFEQEINFLYKNIDKLEKNYFYNYLYRLIIIFVQKKSDKNLETKTFEEIKKMKIDQNILFFLKNIYIFVFSKNINDSKKIRTEKLEKFTTIISEKKG